MSKRIYKFILIAIFLLLPCLSTAADNTAHITRWYKVYWNNAYIADLKVAFTGNGLISQINSLGIVKKVSKYDSRTYSRFHEDKGVYVEEYFESRLKQRQGTKEARIYYSKEGKIQSETLAPPENRAKRPVVADNAKADAVDPLLAALVARDKIKAGLSSGTKQFNFNIYDGRRLSKLEFNIYGKEKIKILEKIQDVVKISFRRTPIAGFTHNELKRMKGEEPDFVLYLMPDTLMPVKADAAAPLGKVLFMFEKECKSIEECR